MTSSLWRAATLSIVLAAAAWAQNTADVAYNNGYQSGYKQGQADGRASKPASFEGLSVYRRATEGWREGLGDLETYRTNFKAGFADGYREGHKETHRSGGPPPKPAAPAADAATLNDEAYANGYREGHRAGRSDAGRSFRLNSSIVYREAQAGYDASRFPSLDEYRTHFRQGFEYGYDDGYNERAADPRRGARRGGGSGAAVAKPSPQTVAVAPEGTVLQLRLNSSISTKTSRQGDRFTATVTEPVYATGTSDTLIPAGSTIAGTVTQVERPGRVRGTASLNLRYETLTLPGGRALPIQASTAGVGDSDVKGVEDAEGTVKGKDSKGRDTATVGGGAALGAIIGGIAGGGRGAAIGAAVGAGAGTAGVLSTRGKDIDLPSGTNLQIRLLREVQVR